MAKATLVWDGLAEFQAELQALPEDCRGEAAKAIEGGVNSAYQTISSVYGRHRFTGTLQRRLTIKATRGGLVLRSGSPIAWLFDNGSQARHYTGTDKRGRVYVNASRGAMWGKTPNPPTHIFSRTVGAERRKLAALFVAMLLRRGAVSVVDDAA